jgi:hypothetical protein
MADIFSHLTLSRGKIEKNTAIVGLEYRATR